MNPYKVIRCHALNHLHHFPNHIIDLERHQTAKLQTAGQQEAGK